MKLYGYINKTRTIHWVYNEHYNSTSAKFVKKISIYFEIRAVKYNNNN
jgi:hypothetical protein